MRIDEYERMHALEDFHWWYRGLRERVLRLLDRFVPGFGAVGREGARLPAILDAGCGTGGMAQAMSPFATVTCMDLLAPALERCRRRGLSCLVAGTVEAVPFADHSFDAVVSLDVLYHAGVSDDHRAARELARVLRPDGVLILNLPAYNWLRGHHDLVIHTARRYTRGQVHALMEAAGLTVVWSSHWNSLLLPVAVTVRMAQRLAARFAPPGSDLRPVAPLLNQALGGVLAVERRLMEVADLPFGLSVLAVGRRAARAE